MANQNGVTVRAPKNRDRKDCVREVVAELDVLRAYLSDVRASDVTARRSFV